MLFALTFHIDIPSSGGDLLAQTSQEDIDHNRESGTEYKLSQNPLSKIIIQAAFN